MNKFIVCWGSCAHIEAVWGHANVGGYSPKSPFVLIRKLRTAGEGSNIQRGLDVWIVPLFPRIRALM